MSRKHVRNTLLGQVTSFVHYYQSAYTQNRCVEDYALHFLDIGNNSNFKCFAKIVFVDFRFVDFSASPNVE